MCFPVFFCNPRLDDGFWRKMWYNCKAQGGHIHENELQRRRNYGSGAAAKQPEFLLGFYEEREFLKVEKKLMHLYLHGILGHFSRRCMYEDARLIDSIMDYQTWYIEYCLKNHGPEWLLPPGVKELMRGWGDKLPGMSLGEIYRQAKLEKPLEEALYQSLGGAGFGVSDDHGFWNRPQIFMQIQKVQVSKKWTEWSQGIFGGEGGNLIEVADQLRREERYPVFGFGGTSFRPVFDRIERLRKEENLEPDCLIYFTDGDGEYPEKQPEYPVIFIEEKPCAEAPKWVQQIMIDK